MTEPGHTHASIHYTAAVPEERIGRIQLTLRDRRTDATIAEVIILYDGAQPEGWSYDYQILAKNQETVTQLAHQFDTPLSAGDAQLAPHSHQQFDRLLADLCSEYKLTYTARPLYKPPGLPW
ncbi:hypothetical protein HYW32_01750 [Candidatus Berkelbacteria bacterium]|nr:hypothetical protein [Candidatus Berkelbacteria bacterium]